MFNASANFGCVPVSCATSITNMAAYDCFVTRPVTLQTNQHRTWPVTQWSLQGRTLPQGLPISSLKRASILFINVMFPLWVALCSLWFGVNHNCYGEGPQCHSRGITNEGKGKKQLLAFSQNIQLLAIICNDLGTRPTWPPESQRGQILHSKNSLAGLSLVLLSGNTERIFQGTFKLLCNFWGIAIIYN